MNPILMILAVPLLAISLMWGLVRASDPPGHEPCRARHGAYESQTGVCVRVRLEMVPL
jgi:hypothetical protein